MNIYMRYLEYVLYVLYACMRSQLASPAVSGMTIILKRLCITQLKPYAREINHICNAGGSTPRYTQLEISLLSIPYLVLLSDLIFGLIHELIDGSLRRFPQMQKVTRIE